MRLIAVLDLMGGIVVHAIAGKRADYRPLESALGCTAAPLDVARAIRRVHGITELYLADLDALGGAEPAFAVYDALQAEGFRLWIDAGRRLEPSESRRCIIGLESATGPKVLDDSVCFSLDLRDGVPLRPWAADADAVAALAVARGVRSMIVLDLAQVGTASGTGTEALCGRLRGRYPALELITGGGVRDSDDLARLSRLGVDAALVASMLHGKRPLE